MHSLSRYRLLARKQNLNYNVLVLANRANGRAIGKMRNCGMRKVKCGIQKCGKVCGMVGKTQNAERTVYVFKIFSKEMFKNPFSFMVFSILNVL